MITSDSILTPAAREFIAQWYDGSQYIKAHTSGSTGAPKEIDLDKNDMRGISSSHHRVFRSERRFDTPDPAFA